LKVFGGAHLAAAGASLGAAASADSSMTSPHHHSPLIVMTYVGPLVMSLGCFALIFAFVVFCEARDHAIAYYVRTRRYAASARGPRGHARLPFRRGVVEHIVEVTRRRAQRKAASFRRPAATSCRPCLEDAAAISAETNVGSGENAALIVPSNDDCFKIDCQPALLPLHDDVVTTTDWLLSNGMPPQTVSLSLFLPPDCVHMIELGPSSSKEDASFIQPSIEPVNDNCFQIDCQLSPADVVTTTDWLLSNELPQTASVSFCPSSDSVVVNRPSAVSQSSQWSLGSGMLSTESACDPTSDGCCDQPEIDSVCSERPVFADDRSADLSASSEVLRQLSPDRDGRISDGKRADVADFLQSNEKTVEDVSWIADRSSEVMPVITVDNLENRGATPQNDELTTTSTICGQSPVASKEVEPSSSSSSPVLLGVRLFPESVQSDQIQRDLTGAGLPLSSHLKPPHVQTASVIDDMVTSASDVHAGMSLNGKLTDAVSLPEVASDTAQGLTEDPDDRSSPTAGSSEEESSKKRLVTLPGGLDRRTPLSTSAADRAGVGCRRGGNHGPIEDRDDRFSRTATRNDGERRPTTSPGRLHRQSPSLTSGRADVGPGRGDADRRDYQDSATRPRHAGIHCPPPLPPPPAVSPAVVATAARRSPRKH